MSINPADDIPETLHELQSTALITRWQDNLIMREVHWLNYEHVCSSTERQKNRLKEHMLPINTLEPENCTTKHS